MFGRLVVVTALALLAGACKFDGSGVGGGDGGGDDDFDASDPIDGAPDHDGDTNPVDAEVPDAEVPDATPDLDLDDDTILDLVDNCVSIPNTDQHDEDADTVGDVCDNCPHVQNTNQANSGEEDAGLEADGLGDVCDPDGDVRHEILLFEPFQGNALPAGWTAIGGTWTVSGDELHQTTTTQSPMILHYTAQTWDAMVVDATIDLDTVLPDGGGSDVRSVGTLAFYTAGATFGTGYLCSLYDEIDTAANAAMFLSRLADNGATAVIGTGIATDAPLADGQTFFARTTAAAMVQRCDAVRGMAWTRTGTDATHTSGTVALRVTAIAASWRHVVVIGEVTP